ncbi:hypothetical protein KIPB_003188 [Kipferlia bialata]|uniref:Uncharacterized protein n=1 Tax=Kipferlia bialata TaxID=797122 RepID=A0A9K3CU26_9EUKA|nr:hypothetical protein KIPB_003188 [Kipferlia bialata]|eukprot:g3188.t1
MALLVTEHVVGILMEVRACSQDVEAKARERAEVLSHMTEGVEAEGEEAETDAVDVPHESESEVEECILPDTLDFMFEEAYEALPIPGVQVGGDAPENVPKPVSVSVAEPVPVPVPVSVSMADDAFAVPAPIDGGEREMGRERDGEEKAATPAASEVEGQGETVHTIEATPYAPPPTDHPESEADFSRDSDPAARPLGGDGADQSVVDMQGFFTLAPSAGSNIARVEGGKGTSPSLPSPHLTPHPPTQPPTQPVRSSPLAKDGTKTESPKSQGGRPVRAYVSPTSSLNRKGPRGGERFSAAGGGITSSTAVSAAGASSGTRSLWAASGLAESHKYGKTEPHPPQTSRVSAPSEVNGGVDTEGLGERRMKGAVTASAPDSSPSGVKMEPWRRRLEERRQKKERARVEREKRIKAQREARERAEASVLPTLPPACFQTMVYTKGIPKSMPLGLLQLCDPPGPLSRHRLEWLGYINKTHRTWGALPTSQLRHYLTNSLPYLEAAIRGIPASLVPEGSGHGLPTQNDPSADGLDGRVSLEGMNQSMARADMYRANSDALLERLHGIEEDLSVHAHMDAQSPHTPPLTPTYQGAEGGTTTTQTPPLRTSPGMRPRMSVRERAPGGKTPRGQGRSPLQGTSPLRVPVSHPSPLHPLSVDSTQPLLPHPEGERERRRESGGRRRSQGRESAGRSGLSANYLQRTPGVTPSIPLKAKAKGQGGGAPYKGGTLPTQVVALSLDAYSRFKGVLHETGLLSAAVTSFIREQEGE